jgi:hypothetical protein
MNWFVAGPPIGARVASGNSGFPRGLLQHFVDQSLVGFISLCGQAPKLRQKPGRNANGNKLFRIYRFWPANPASSSQLFVGGLRNVRKIDSLSLHMLCALWGSRVAQ